MIPDKRYLPRTEYLSYFGIKMIRSTSYIRSNELLLITFDVRNQHIICRRRLSVCLSVCLCLVSATASIKEIKISAHFSGSSYTSSVTGYNDRFHVELEDLGSWIVDLKCILNFELLD